MASSQELSPAEKKAAAAAKREADRAALRARMAAGRARKSETTTDVILDSQQTSTPAQPTVRAATPPPDEAQAPVPALQKQRSFLRHNRTPTKDIVAVSPAFDAARPPAFDLPPVPFASGDGLGISSRPPSSPLPSLPRSSTPAAQYDSDSSSLEEFNQSLASAEQEESLMHGGDNEDLLLASDDDGEFPSLLAASTSYKELHPLVATPGMARRYSSSDEEKFDLSLESSRLSSPGTPSSPRFDSSAKLGATIASALGQPEAGSSRLLSPASAASSPGRLSSPKQSSSSRIQQPRRQSAIPRPLSPASSNGSAPSEVSRLPRPSFASSIPRAPSVISTASTQRAGTPRRSMIATPSRLPAASKIATASKLPAR